MNSILLYFYTLKHLKLEQVFNRILRRFRKVYINNISCKLTNSWSWSGTQESGNGIFEGSTFVFLNQRGVIKNKGDWDCSSKTKLWLYNLHYFDYLKYRDTQSRKENKLDIIDTWISHNPPCNGTGWEPYPLSLRLVNWVKWFSKKESAEQKYLNSIMQQANALSQQLEYHILGNHLFANAKALTFVGAYLQGEEAERFLKLGLKILDREIEEQFLADGAHFELSPMYHEILVWDLLELIDLAKTSQNIKLLARLNKWQLVAKKALYWLKTMIHPDGEISFFNDAAIGIAASPAEIFSYASKLGIEYESPSNILTTNHASGYSRVQNDKYTLLFDHANVGPDYLPGHAHADSLSFEMSVGTQRVFVNSGTSLYGVSKERLRQRETSAHNTVVVGGQSSSEVWSGFRVARRAYSRLIQAEENTGNVTLSASHDGYKRLKPKVTHTRTINALSDSCIITDDLSIKTAAEFNLHVHPDVELKQVNQTCLELSFACESKVILVSSHNYFIEDSTWHPEFGKTIPNKKIVIPFNNSQLITEIKIQKE